MRLFSLRSTTLDPVPGVPAQPMPRCHDGIPWTCRGQAEAASPLDLPGSWMDVGSHRRRPLGTWGLGQARSLPCGPEPLPGRNPIRRVDGASCCRVAAEMQLSNRRWNPRTTWAIENFLASSPQDWTTLPCGVGNLQLAARHRALQWFLGSGQSWDLSRGRQEWQDSNQTTRSVVPRPLFGVYLIPEANVR